MSDTEDIIKRLDKIIEFLELRNGIAVARNEMLMDRVEIQIPGISDTNLCNYKIMDST